MKTAPPFEILKYETYIRMIENSVGTRMFASLFVKDRNSGEVKDIFNNGEYSCASFVSSLLTLVRLLSRPRATTHSLEQELLEKGWYLVEAPFAPGDILSWKPIAYPDGSSHGHVGFYAGDDDAISTDSRQGIVTKHHVTFGVDGTGLPMRPIISAYRFSW